MAYYLLIPPTTAAVRVQLLSDITQTASGNFEIEFEVDILGTNGIVAADNAGNGQNIIFFTTLTNLQLRIANSQRNFTLPQSAAGRHVYRIVSSTAAGNIQVFQDGVSCGTTAGNNFWSIGRIADLNNQVARHFGLYYFKVRDASNTLIHHYDPSASNGTGSTLIDNIAGNNGSLQNFQTDNSQWVFYDGGGSTEQITNSGGIASALAGGAASTQIISEQVFSRSGIAVAVTTGIASATIVNEQVNLTGGIASTIASAIASTSVINEQALSSGGIVAAIAGATASTQVINEQTSEQIVSSGGIAASIGSASASTQVIHDQVVNSGGVAPALAGGVGVNSLANEQVISTGGTVASFAELVADTQILHEQIIVSSAQAQALASGYANTQIVNEQSGAQIITTGGESASAAATAASTQFINEQIVSTAGLSQAYFSALLTSVVINRINVQLAPDRMIATRLAPLITAQYVQTNITADRLINNITAQRV